MQDNLRGLLEASVVLRKATLQDQALVQEILDDIPTYMINVEGVSKRHDAAMSELTSLPPKCDPAQKISLLICQGTAFIGFIDIIRDFPKPGTAMLGLLAIRESKQKSNLGRSAYECLEKYVAENFGSKIMRIGVNDTNPVQVFWEKVGFKRTGEIKTYEGVARKSSVVVMEKHLK